MNNPEISVIMGVYNICENVYMIEKSISSIVDQTFGKWECVICDDGSNDGTWDYLNEKLKGDNRFTIIRNEENMGLRVALNRCIDVAKAPYLVRQDADDYSRKDRFEILKKRINERPDIDVLGTAMILFDNNEEWGIRKPRSLNPQKKDFLKGSIVAHATCIIKKESLIKVGGYRVAWETMRCEDYDLFMRMHAEGMKIHNINEPLYYVREDKECYSRKKYRNRIKESVVRFKGYKKINMPIYGYVYVLKPLIIGILPAQLQLTLKKGVEYWKK